MLRKAKNLSVKLILLTHAHTDHVVDLPRLREETGAHVFAPSREPVPSAQPMDEGKHFRCGKIDIDTRLTSGHSPGAMTFVVSGLARPIAIVGDSLFAGSMGGGTTFFVRGLDRPVAIVGDSLFAGSMGGGNVSYEDAVRNNLEKILTLPDDTIVCPGHGPMTTIGEEKIHNPFFAGKVK